MMLATPTAPTISATAPEPEEEAVERACGRGPCGEHVGRLAGGRLVGCLGVGGLREQRLHGGLVTGGGAAVDRAGRAGFLLAVDDADIAEILLGGRITDQGADVDVGLERRGPPVCSATKWPHLCIAALRMVMPPGLLEDGIRVVSRRG